MTEQIDWREKATITGGLRLGSSEELRNCFKDNIGDIPERRGGAHMGLPEST